MTCCQLILRQEGVVSPFNRLISSSYYDGTTGGICSCAVCGREYFYDLFSWDEGQDVRIFGFSALQSGSFERLALLCRRYDTPRWPEWLPNFNHREGERDREEFQAMMDDLRREKEPTRLV